jgi:2-iminobutanoate/2-iminopropanoate deaminase
MKKILGSPVKFPNGDTAPISKGVQANNLVFTSGQLGLTDQGALAEDNIEGQLRQAIINVESVLNESGCGLQDVIKITAWLTDPSDFARFNHVYAEYFGNCPPARSTVVSSLLIPGARVEIEAIALVPAT